MDYRRIYNQLCERSRHRIVTGYTEKHHILPKSLGGRNTKNNIVVLTAREHYVAHLCLVRFLVGHDRTKMLHALQCFKRGKGSQRTAYQTMKMNGRLHEHLRQQWMDELSKRMKGNVLSKGIRYSHSYKRDSTNIGRYTRTAEVRAKVSESRTGKAMGARNAMNDPEARKKVGLSKIGRRLYIGPSGERRMFGIGWEPEGFTRAR